MNLLFPKFRSGELPAALVCAVISAFIAGAYGMIHDQLTYTLSPEYFTCLKFDQFRGADFGFVERVFVAEIGFLATWWMGLIPGWFLARIALPWWPLKEATVELAKAIARILAITLIFGIAGWIAGVSVDEPGADWIEFCSQLGVKDVRAFMIVGYIHNAGYLGGIVGVLTALAWLLRARKRNLSAD